MSQTASEVEVLCAQRQILTGVCSCGAYNNCGLSPGYACFFPETLPSCVAPCRGDAPAATQCACSPLYNSQREATLIYPGEICGNFVLGLCQSGCFHCDAKRCLVCHDSYVRVHGRCEKCPEGCWKCSADKHCQLCERGWRLEGYACVQCEDAYGHDLCLYEGSHNGDNTGVCYFSYYFDSIAGKCCPCQVPGCARCDSDPRRCDSCFTGQFDGEKCPKCDGNCSCLSGYRTTSNCVECDKLNAMDGGCKSCGSGYVLGEFASCEKAQKEPGVPVHAFVVGGLLFIFAITVLAVGACLKYRYKHRKFHSWIGANPERSCASSKIP